MPALLKPILLFFFKWDFHACSHLELMREDTYKDKNLRRKSSWKSLELQVLVLEWQEDSKTPHVKMLNLEIFIVGGVFLFLFLVLVVVLNIYLWVEKGSLILGNPCTGGDSSRVSTAAL